MHYTKNNSSISKINNIMYASRLLSLHSCTIVDLCVGLYVYFTDWTRCKAARIVIPNVRTTRPQMHARLIAVIIIRLSCAPVGVVHYRHCITVRISGSHSPDECRLTTWVYTLSSRPEVDSIRRVFIASTQCGLWNITHLLVTERYQW